MAQSSDPAARTMRAIRSDFRTEVRSEIVELATELLDAKGAAAFTMKKLADEFGSSIGTIYRHFGSKDELLAAVDAQRLQGIAVEARADADQLQAQLASSDLSHDARALARVLGAGRFWIEASGRAPDIVRHARHVVGDPSLAPAKRSEATDHLLHPLRSALDHATELGALSDGHTSTRAGLILAIVPIPTCAPHLWEAPESDPALGIALLGCLLGQWGAQDDDLAEAHAHLTALAS